MNEELNKLIKEYGFEMDTFSYDPNKFPKGPCKGYDFKLYYRFNKGEWILSEYKSRHKLLQDFVDGKLN